MTMTGAAGSAPTPAATVLDRATVEAALAVAVRAPSIHNTQPWRWRLAGGALELIADRSRQLTVADPDGHSLLVSCGAALHLTEIALRAAGSAVQAQLLPDPDDHDLLARFTPVGAVEPDEAVLGQAEAALRRRSGPRALPPPPPQGGGVRPPPAPRSGAGGWVHLPVD